LSQALHELGFQVEHCPEIFRAIEKLTGHNFGIIAADWDDGVEASFLLKTARDLKSSSQAFTLAIAKPEWAGAAQRAGANLILSKPILPGQVRHALLNSDQFVSLVRPPRVEVEAARRLAPPAPTHEPKKPAPTFLKTRPAPPSPLPPEEDVLPLGAPVEPSALPGPPDPFERTPIQTLFSSETWAAKMQAAPRKGGLRRFLRRGFTGLMVLAAGGALYGPLRSGALTASVGQIYRNARATTQNWLKPSPLPVAEAEVLPPRTERISLLPRRVITIRVGKVRPRLSDPQEISQALAREPLASLAQLGPDSKILQPSPVAFERHIPESLKTAPAVRDFSPRISPSLLATLEPVGLSSDTSEKLLIQKIEPAYPEQAVRAGLQGLVVLQAAIGKDGLVHDLKLISGSWLLAQAACQAVRQWRYKPYFMNGHPVEAQTLVTVDFKLPSVASVAEP
jgi:TonB family protein